MHPFPSEAVVRKFRTTASFSFNYQRIPKKFLIKRIFSTSISAIRLNFIDSNEKMRYVIDKSTDLLSGISKKLYLISMQNKMNRLAMPMKATADTLDVPCKIAKGEGDKTFWNPNDVQALAGFVSGQ